MNTKSLINIFDGLSRNYNLYRPGYPKKLFEKILSYVPTLSEVADIGAGTGIFTEGLLNAGYKIYAVEPNNDMRKESDSKFKNKNVTIVKGSAEHTNLLDSSVNLITIAQAFHWIDIDVARKEFIRISKNRCNIAIAWNTRKFDASPFMSDLKEFFVENAPDYNMMREKYWGNLDKKVKSFYKDNCDLFSFSNFQFLLWEEFIGYLLSLSYAPCPASSLYGIFVEAAKKLFDKYKKDNCIKIDLEAKLYIGTIT